jgi:hypothetical protein
MECEVDDRLEKDFTKVRERGPQASIERELTKEEVLQFAWEVDEARSRLLDHRSEHGCKRPGE